MRDGWTETTLGDIAEVVGGGTPSTSKDEFWDGDVIWLTPTEVTAIDGKVISDSKRKITHAGLRSSGARILPRGTVVLTSRASVGFVAIAGKELTTNQGFQSLIPSATVNEHFLMFWIQLNRSEFESRSAGSTFKEISKSNVKSIQIALPPLDEQKRIVDVVSSVDAYIDALQQQADTARIARNAVLQELLSAGGDDWAETTLDDLVLSEVVLLGRGNVISKKDMEADPGPYPVYSSAQNNDGQIGSFNKFMFDEELITWSVDGGGHVFYRPHHKFSVTNIGGYLRILDSSKFLYPFLAAVLKKLHGQHVFDWQNKAHPSVIRKLYNNIPLAPLAEQKRIVEVFSSMDEVIQSTEQAVVDAKNLRSGLLSDLLSGQHEIPTSYDVFVGAA
jgi:type I restriction enzyme S subunit